MYNEEMPNHMYNMSYDLCYRWLRQWENAMQKWDTHFRNKQSNLKKPILSNKTFKIVNSNNHK